MQEKFTPYFAMNLTNEGKEQAGFTFILLFLLLYIIFKVITQQCTMIPS